MHAPSECVKHAEGNTCCCGVLMTFQGRLLSASPVCIGFQSPVSCHVPDCSLIAVCASGGWCPGTSSRQRYLAGTSQTSEGMAQWREQTYDSAVEICIPVVCMERELLPMDLSDVWCKCPGACPHDSADCKCADACLGRAAVICQPERSRLLATSASRPISSLFSVVSKGWRRGFVILFILLHLDRCQPR